MLVLVPDGKCELVVDVWIELMQDERQRDLGSGKLAVVFDGFFLNDLRFKINVAGPIAFCNGLPLVLKCPEPDVMFVASRFPFKGEEHGHLNSLADGLDVELVLRVLGEGIVVGAATCIPSGVAPFVFQFDLGVF